MIGVFHAGIAALFSLWLWSGAEPVPKLVRARKGCQDHRHPHLLTALVLLQRPTPALLNWPCSSCEQAVMQHCLLLKLLVDYSLGFSPFPPVQWTSGCWCLQMGIQNAAFLIPVSFLQSFQQDKLLVLSSSPVTTPCATPACFVLHLLDDQEHHGG